MSSKSQDKGQNQLSLQWQIQPAVAPDGSRWVSVSILFGMASFTFGIPVEKRHDFLSEFRSAVQEAARQAIAAAPNEKTAGGLYMPTGEEIRQGHTCGGKTDPERCLGCRIVQAAGIGE